MAPCPTRPAGLGPIGVEELGLDAAQLVGQDGAPDGVEHQVAQPVALEALGQVHAAPVALVGCFVLRAVGIGVLGPVVQDPD